MFASPGDVTVDLHRYEIEHLAEWHRTEQYECANREDYVSAADHKRRHKELIALVQSSSNDGDCDGK
jgi:hypothetical protein